MIYHLLSMLCSLILRHAICQGARSLNNTQFQLVRILDFYFSVNPSLQLAPHGQKAIIKQNSETH